MRCGAIRIIFHTFKQTDKEKHRFACEIEYEFPIYVCMMWIHMKRVIFNNLAIIFAPTTLLQMSALSLFLDPSD